MSESKPVYKRVLLKLSGEALMGSQESGIDPDMINRVAQEIHQVVELGVQLGVVIGAGNIFRGKGLADSGMDRVTGDHMGMLATVMNCLALQDAIEKLGPSCRVMSALSIHQVCEDYVRRRAIRHLEKGRVVIFGAGTGNPFFTTDSAGSLRAIEIEADALMKATKVDGVYDSDPMKNPHAIRYDSLTYDEVLVKNLAIMDATAIVLCKEQNMPLRIFNLNEPGDLVRTVLDKSIGTSVVPA
ncbi:Uridine monophosphate kinase [hydrothermal vent metagenome]|uniref:Uridylate kinase n=1 Tax=hydrothermal vent metagenome TaxID=652676 RepID=A0A3B0XR17_9ZZZZ